MSALGQRLVVGVLTVVASVALPVLSDARVVPAAEEPGAARVCNTRGRHVNLERIQGRGRPCAPPPVSVD